MNITLSIDKNLEAIIKESKYIKWTEIARDAIREKAIELKKEELFNRYMKKEKLSDKAHKWMEEIDWHPVDELELKDVFVKEIKKIKIENKNRKITKIKDINKHFDNL